MEAIITSDVYQNNGTNRELMELAFYSHPKCYVDGGFCSDILPSYDNLKCLSDIYILKDFFSIRAIHQVWIGYVYV